MINRTKKFGYTFFTGGAYQKQVNVNKDELRDVPNLKSFFPHSRLFFYPNAKQTLILGYYLTYEDRKGGDIQVLQPKQDDIHQFFILNKSISNTADVELETKLNDKDRLTFRGKASFLIRISPLIYLP